MPHHHAAAGADFAYRPPPQPALGHRAAPVMAGSQTFSRALSFDTGPKISNTKSKAADMRSETVKDTAEKISLRFKDLYKAFKHFDQDKNGTLNEKEIKRALYYWRVPIEKEDLKKLMAECDKDGNGEIDYKEFVTVLLRRDMEDAGM